MQTIFIKLSSSFIWIRFARLTLLKTKYNIIISKLRNELEEIEIILWGEKHSYESY
jgi:hypothetical protein